VARERSTRPEARPLRLFVAVELPEDVRALVEHGVAPVRERYPEGRWVPVANQHVTVKFLGTTWPRLLRPVTRAVEEVAVRHDPVSTRVATLGAFPSPRRARVLWVGLEDPQERLRRIAADLDDALARDFPPEKRAFTPHLTVARFDPPVALEQEIGALGVESRPFVIDALTLFRSHLRRPSPVYEPLARFHLRVVDPEHTFE
jgi:2'-5' RNA ligase